MTFAGWLCGMVVSFISFHFILCLVASIRWYFFFMQLLLLLALSLSSLESTWTRLFSFDSAFSLLLHSEPTKMFSTRIIIILNGCVSHLQYTEFYWFWLWFMWFSGFLRRFHLILSLDFIFVSYSFCIFLLCSNRKNTPSQEEIRRKKSDEGEARRRLLSIVKRQLKWLLVEIAMWCEISLLLSVGRLQTANTNDVCERLMRGPYADVWASPYSKWCALAL